MQSLAEGSLLVVVIVQDAHSLTRTATWYSVHAGRAVQCAAMEVRKATVSKKNPASLRPSKAMTTPSRTRGHKHMSAKTCNYCSRLRRRRRERVQLVPRSRLTPQTMSMSVSDQPAGLVSGCVSAWLLCCVSDGKGVVATFAFGLQGNEVMPLLLLLAVSLPVTEHELHCSTSPQHTTLHYRGGSVRADLQVGVIVSSGVSAACGEEALLSKEMTCRAKVVT